MFKYENRLDSLGSKMRKGMVAFSFALLLTAIPALSAGYEFQSNAATDDLIVYQFQGETYGACYGANAGNVYDAAAESRNGGANNVIRVHDNQGCDFNLASGFEQEFGTYHLHLRIRAAVWDSNDVEQGAATNVFWQLIYSKLHNQATYYSTFVPYGTLLTINPDVTQGTSPRTYTVIDLSDTYSRDWRDYEHGEDANDLIDEWFHVWFSDTTPNAIIYIDSWYVSTIQ